jgi:c-di-GMP-binding flagellar brake protein YcgR
LANLKASSYFLLLKSISNSYCATVLSTGSSIPLASSITLLISLIKAGASAAREYLESSLAVVHNDIAEEKKIVLVSNFF